MSYYFQNTEPDCKHTNNSVYTFKFLEKDFQLKWDVLIDKVGSNCNIKPNLDDANEGIGCDISFESFDIAKNTDTIEFKVNVYSGDDGCNQDFECKWDDIPSKLKQIKKELTTAFDETELKTAYRYL